MLRYGTRQSKSTIVRAGFLPRIAAIWRGARLVTTRGFGHYRILRAAEALEAIASSVAESGLPRQQERRAS